MNYCISKPSAKLSQFVKQYWAMDNCFVTGAMHTQRIVPHGLFELTFYFGDKPVSLDKNKTIGDNTIITGQLGEFYDLQVSGNLSMFSVLFKPQGLSMFLNIPITELYNQNVPLKYIFKSDTNALESKLREAQSFQQRVAIVEHYLLKLLEKNYSKHGFDRMEDSINIINRKRGIVDINYLASEACFSRKQYERNFSSTIGTTPKKFLKVIRFQNTLAEKAKNGNAGLSDLTYQCGYYDQSHMINDFKKLSGLSPRQYFNTCEAYSDYFQ